MKALVMLILLPVWALAQDMIGDPSRLDSGILHQEGKLISLQLVLGEPIRIFFAGREEAKINLDDLTVTVRRLKPYPAKVLSIDRHSDYYAISEPIDPKVGADLEVTTKVKNKTESLHFKIKGKP